MSPIPLRIRSKLAVDPFMRRCIHRGCMYKPEWEHAWTYANRQIQEAWAIVPVCWFHHRGPGLDKNYNRFVSLTRATPEDLNKYPKINWAAQMEYLIKRYARV